MLVCFAFALAPASLPMLYLGTYAYPTARETSRENNLAPAHYCQLRPEAGETVWASAKAGEGPQVPGERVSNRGVEGISSGEGN